MDFFLKDSDDSSNEGRQHGQKRKIVSILNKAGQDLTIPELCKKVRLSVPTGTRLINELRELKVIVESGKKETGNGRPPSLYKVDKNYAFTVGVTVLLKALSISVYNLAMEEVYSVRYDDFILENTSECLGTVSSRIGKSIGESGVEKRKILGMGVGITGRINSKTGTSYSFFNFLEDSLAGYFENEFHFPVYLDNDTHLIGLAEQVFGEARNVKNAFVVNLSQGLGLAIITNGVIVTGEDGFAGEIGHMQITDSSKLCLCGKRGCLGTEVSGYALEENFKDKTGAGEASLLALGGNGKDVNFRQIMKAAREGDALSISLIHQIGFKLGNALGNVLNLLNPGVIIVGGELVPAKEILSDSIKSGMIHTALSLPLRSCSLTFSSIGTDAALKGAGALVLRKKNLI